MQPTTAGEREALAGMYALWGACGEWRHRGKTLRWVEAEDWYDEKKWSEDGVWAWEEAGRQGGSNWGNTELFQDLRELYGEAHAQRAKERREAEKVDDEMVKCLRRLAAMDRRNDTVVIHPDLACMGCGKPDREGVMLVCDCGVGMHMDCLPVPMTGEPVANWECAECVQRKERRGGSL